MNLVTQPVNSNLCGHCCIAMITGKPVDEIIKAIGHINGTRTKELVKVLNDFGISNSGKLTRISKNTSLPFMCIVKLKKKLAKSGHWIVYFNGRVFDPSGFEFEIDTLVYPEGVNKTSYLEIMGLR